MIRLTEGSISTVDNGTIDISAVKDYISLEEGATVLVIGTRSRFIRVIPIKEKQIALIRLRMDLEGFADIGRMIFQSIRNRSLELVHSTGFCPIKDECYYEGYFTVGQRDNIEEFVAWVRTLASILHVELAYLNPEV